MSTKSDEMDRKVVATTRQMVYEHIRETEAVVTPPGGADIVGLDYLLSAAPRVDIAKIGAETKMLVALCRALIAAVEGRREDAQAQIDVARTHADGRTQEAAP